MRGRAGSVAAPAVRRNRLRRERRESFGMGFLRTFGRATAFWAVAMDFWPGGYAPANADVKAAQRCAALRTQCRAAAQMALLPDRCAAAPAADERVVGRSLVNEGGLRRSLPAARHCGPDPSGSSADTARQVRRPLRRCTQMHFFSPGPPQRSYLMPGVRDHSRSASSLESTLSLQPMMRHRLKLRTVQLCMVWSRASSSVSAAQTRPTPALLS